MIAIILNLCYIKNKKAPTPKWMPQLGLRLTDVASSVGRQDWHFNYLFLFLLSRKARIATIKLPKDITNVHIPMNTLSIS